MLRGRVAFNLVALVALSTLGLSSAAQPADSTLPTPNESCASALTPDDEQACLTLYIADRLYEQQTTGAFAVASQSLPVVLVVGVAALGVSLARGGR